MNKMKNDKRVYSLCKRCGEPIKRGKVWNKDIFGNGYHYECYLKLQKYYSFLSESDILGDD